MAAIAPASTFELLDLLCKSNILPAERLKVLPSAESLPAEPRKAATVLVQKGFITKFQGTQLLSGRHKGFRIGPYAILDLLGRGGMGAVYLAEHLDLDRKVAIKVLAPGKGDDQKLALERFLREARAAAALDHPNIVRIFDVARHLDAPYLVMEYVEGETLQQIIDRDGAVPYTTAAEYVAQAAAGLQHASEKGFVHRDIKPGNLIRDKSGTVKILDMGLARSSNDRDKLTELLDNGAVVGTADFIAPEQAINNPNVDVRADIYSLGATFFALIVGKPPFAGNTTQKLLQHQLKSAPTLASLDATLPKGLSAVVAKMLAKKPELRYSTPVEVITALTPWMGNSSRIVAGISRTKLGQGADLHAALQDRSNSGSSLRLRNDSEDPNDSAVVNPSAAVQTISDMTTGETVRTPPASRPAKSTQQKQLALMYAGIGAAIILVGGLVGWLAFGGSKKPDVAKNPPDVQPGPATPPVRPPVQPPVVPPNPKVDPPREEPVFRFDPATVTPFQVRLKGGTIVDGKRGALPQGVAVYALQSDVEAQFAATTIEGVPTLALTRLAGPAGVQLAFELEKDAASNGAGVKLKQGESYRLQIEYRAEAGVQMGVGVHTFQYKPVAEYKVAVSAGDRWQTTEVVFERAADPVRFVIENRTVGATKTVQVRSVTLTRLDSQAPNRPRFTSDLTGLQPFVIRSGLIVDPNDSKRHNYKLISQSGTGALPAGWQALCWNKDTEMEVFAEDAGGKPVLGIRNLRGPGSAMLFAPRFDCPSGLCRLRFEYSSNVRDREFNVRFKPDDQRGAWDVVRPDPTGEGWRTEDLLFDLKGATGGFFEFHNNDSTSGAAVRIRAVSVIEPNPASQDRVVFKLDANDLPPFSNAKTGKDKTSGQDDPRIKGVYFGGWKPESQSEWVCGTVAGAKAIGYTNLNDVISAQIGIELEPQYGIGLRFAEGQTVRLRVVYRTSGKGRGRMYFQNADDFKVFDSIDLPNSNNEWKTVELVTTRGTNPLRCVIDTSAYGASNTLFVRTVTVAETSGTKPVAVTPPPTNPALDPATWAEGPILYSLDVAKIPAFRTQKEKGTRLGGDAEQLPEGIGCHCWKDRAVGDFRRDTLDKVAALGLTNLNDEKSGQYYFAPENGMKVPLKPGKAYRVKVGYRTANDATGGITVHVTPDYKGIGSVALPASGDQWKTAAISFTRPPAEDGVEVRFVIDNDTVGEGNTIWVRSVEIVELIPPKK